MTEHTSHETHLLRRFSHYALAFILLLATVSPHAGAVLKERTLANTLGVLRAELEQQYTKQRQYISMQEQKNDQQHAHLITLMQRYNQISLMLYSQKSDYVFDLTYACEEATDLGKSLEKQVLPYDRIINDLDSRIENLNELITTLEKLPPIINENKEDKTLTELLAKTAAHDSIHAANDTLPAKQKETATNPEKKGVKEPFMLTKAQQEDREKCLLYAKAIRNNMMDMQVKLRKDQSYYETMQKRINKLSQDAHERYTNLQYNIFKNGNDNYFKMLSELDRNFKRASMDVREKYSSLESVGEKRQYNAHSEWRGATVNMFILFVIFYIIVASLLSNIIIRWIVPVNIRKKPEFIKLRPLLLVTLGMFIFMVSINIARLSTDHPFLLSAASLLIDVAFLTQILLISLLIRLTATQCISAVKMYMPFLIMTFIVISFRVMFIPNNLVNIIYPPILLIFTIWQFRTMKKDIRKQIPESDVLYSTVSGVTMIVATVCSWCGYTLFAVEMIIWWMLQLTTVQTLTMLYSLSKGYRYWTLIRPLAFWRANNKGKKAKIGTDVIKPQGIRPFLKFVFNQNEEREQEREHELQAESNETKHKLKDINERLHAEELAVTKEIKSGLYFKYTWIFDMCNRAIFPVLGVLSILYSVIMAASVFNMSEIFAKIFFINFIDEKGIVQVSLFKLCLVTSCYFIFSYFNYALHALYRQYKESHPGPNGMANLTLANNIISIIVWGIYCIFALILLQVPKDGISIITAGLATGMGFAMKDLLENFFYGISLMSGRVRVGDYIECDGILGKVESITYQSTQIITGDGSVIAFLNSALFTKNFKNLTRNHNYMLVTIPIGVAYGAEIPQVRTILQEAMQVMIAKKREQRANIVRKGYPVSVCISDFGDNSVNLLVKVWVLVEEKIGFVADAQETIYDALNKHGIEIPFPQTDLHIRDSVSLPIQITHE